MSFYAKYNGMGGGGSSGGVTSLDGLTGDLTLVAGTGISIVDGTDTITISSTSAGDVTLTTFGSSPNANGASLVGQQLQLQPADVTNPGGVSTTTQSFAGDKTFTGAIAASNLSGTNTGDVTIGTANGLSLIGQSLSLDLSSASTTGALSSTDWNTFNGKQAAGSYITALTGDATATGPGSAALTLATVNSNIGTFAAVTVNGKGLVTAAADLNGDATTSGTTLTLATVNSNIGTFASVTVNAKGLVTAATALNGDATTSGASLTLATVNSNVGSFGTSSSVGTFTVNAKGLITAASDTPIQIAESQVTNLVTDLAAKQSTSLTNAHILVGNGSGVAADVAVSGDLTLANTGAFTIANLAVTNAKIANSTIDLTAKVTGALPIANGGTGQTTKAAAFNALSPIASAGDLIVGDGPNSSAVITSTTGQAGVFPAGLNRSQRFLSQLGSSGETGWRYMLPPKISRYTSGSGTHQKRYYFILSTNANATAAAIYTSGGNTYTVQSTISSGLTLEMTGDGDPANSGTLTKSAGTGDSTIAFQAVAMPLYFKVRTVGPGGGGGGSSDGTGNGGAGSAGSADTTFGNLTAGKGSGGPGSTSGDTDGGAGGTATVGAGWTSVIAQAGGRGGANALNSVTAAFFRQTGGIGGGTFFASGTVPAIGNTATGPANTGVGGGGGGVASSGNCRTGTGGGGGAYIEAIAYSPSATYSYAVGSGGGGGSAGTNGGAGSDGTAGQIIIEEYFQ